MKAKKSIVYSTLAVIIALAFTACASTSAPEPSPVSVPALAPKPVPVASPGPSALEKLNSAIRDVSDYLNDTIPAGNMAAFINIQSGSEEFSDFIIDNLIANAVNDRIFTVVDRHQLEVIRREQDFQLSADVDDETALSIGRFVGAQTIVSGRVSSFAGHFHLTIRALDVQTAQVQGQYIQNLGTQTAISALIGGAGGQVAVAQAPAPPARQTSMPPTQPIAQAPMQPVIQVPAQQSSQIPAQPAPAAAIQPGEILVPGASLAEKLHWLETNAANNTRYHIEVRRNERITPQTFSFPRVRNVTVRLSGDGEERIISLWDSGSLFTVESGVTLILDSGITLQGIDRNAAPLVIVDNRGELIMNAGARISGNSNTLGGIPGGGVLVEGHATFIMNGGEISGNYAPHGSGGGVRLGRNGSFTMTGGIISDNNARYSGGGVYMSAGTSFTMNGGKIFDNFASNNGGGVLVGTNGNFSMVNGIIYGNSSTHGGGVSILSRATFTMASGEISGNRAGHNGGGVHIGQEASFAMRGGELYGNTASIHGGGVFIEQGNFTMTDGEISGNTASIHGGGVLVGSGGIFTKTGGTIFGSTGSRNDNRAGNGHAVLVLGMAGGGRRNTTAGPGVRLDSRSIGTLGGWES